MQKFLSTDAKRKAIAHHVSELATRALGHPVTLERGGEYEREEYHFRAENLETERGRLAHLTLDVSPRGISVHIRFDCPGLAPSGANEYSGKWNHYIWPRHSHDAASYMQAATLDLESIFAEVQILKVVRCDRPGPELWDYWREEFAKDCAARAVA